MMTGTLLRLTFWSMRNRLRVRLRRLRQPRYVIGTIAAAVYFYFIFGGFRRGRRRPPGAEAIAPLDRFRGLIELGGALRMFVLVALSWVWPTKRGPSLTFTPAEVQFLFTAPVRRRTLVIYRVLRSLASNVFLGAIMTLVFRPPSAARGWILFAGTSLVFAILNLHLMGVSLSRASLAAHGWSGLARQWLPVSLVLGVLAVLGVTIASHWAVLSALSGMALVSELHRLLSTGAAGIALWPFRALVRLPTAESAEAFLRALPAALLLLGGNFLWVIRSDVAFEEASAAAAEKIAQFKAGKRPVPSRPRRLRSPFALAPLGRPEVAFLWKNLILVGRYASLKTFARVLPIIIVMGFAMTRGASAGGGGLWAGVAIACLICAGFTTIFGPQMARNDLRQDLAHLSVLKAWPVAGGAVVRGEVLAPAVLLSAVTALFIAGAVAFSGQTRALTGIPIADRAAYTIAALLLAPGLIVTQLMLQNGLAVLFPAWLSPGPRARQGFDVMGQRMLMLYGMLFVLIIALIPAALAAGAVGYGIYATTGAFPVLIPSLIATLVLLIQAGILSTAVGRVFDRTDVSAVDAADT
jgi:hypothetical protein